MKRSTALAVAIAVTVAACGSGRSGLDAAQHIVVDRAAFDDSQTAARSFARIADDLLDVGRSCNEHELSCQWLNAGAAFAHVMASVAPRCTTAEVEPARAALETYLARAPESVLPPSPSVPTCT